MNDIITKIKTTNIEELYNKIVNSNLTEEELIQELSNNPCLLNSFLHFYSTINGTKELTSNITKAIEIIEYNKFLEFEKTTKNNTHIEYLSQLDWLSKCFLYFEIDGMLEDGHPVLHKYKDDIKYSIKKDESNPEYLEIIQEHKHQQQIMNELLYPKKTKK